MTIAALFTLALVASPTLATAKEKISNLENGEWLSLSGVVKSVSDDGFTLTHGNGRIKVVMEGHGWFDKDAVDVGDRVTVSGRMDKKFFEKKEIMASSVYLPTLNEYFYAGSMDDAKRGAYPVTEFNWNRTVDGAEWVAVTGVVDKIEGKKMSVNIGFRDIAVDASGIETTPIAGTIHVGDRVAVTGEMKNTDLFDKQAMKASSVVVLTHDVTGS
jgi:uncharacterized protein YdeI (BOF family)